MKTGAGQVADSPPILGISAVANIHYGRQILIGVRNYCETSGAAEMNYLSEDGSIPAQADPGITFKAIVAHLGNRRELARARLLATAVVCTSSRNLGMNVPYVVTDDRAVGRMAAEYFLLRGYKRFLFVGREGHTYARMRLTGYRDRLRAEGLPVEELLFCAESESLPMERILRHPFPLALFAANDIVARMIIGRLRRHGVAVPGEVAVLGVDDDPIERAISLVALSSIRLAGERVGTTAAKLALDLANGKSPPSAPILVPPEFVVTRRSTDHFALGDTLVVKAIQRMRGELRNIAGVPDLVALLKVSRRALEIRFRKATGRTIHQEICRARIERARELLADPAFSVGEISQLTGFADQRMLAKVFKRETGLTPSEYRNSVK